MVEKQEAKILSAPTGKLKNGNLSIQELLRKQKEEKEKEIQSGSANKPTEDFSLDDLKMHWRKFAFKQKNAGLDTLFSALTVNEPFFNEDEMLITHHVDNLVQLEFMRSHESDLIQFLRASLKNFDIQLKTMVNQSEDSKKKMYTGKDKFEEMAKRNPNLEILKKLFKLDIDF